MKDSRTIKLAHLIKEGTESGKLKWNSSPQPFTYRLSLGIGMVEIWQDPENDYLSDGSLSPVYQLTIFNDRNEIIDLMAVCIEQDEHYRILKELYEKAESNYLNKDKTYESMFGDLLPI